MDTSGSVGWLKSLPVAAVIELTEGEGLSGDIGLTEYRHRGFCLYKPCSRAAAYMRQENDCEARNNDRYRGCRREIVGLTNSSPRIEKQGCSVPKVQHCGMVRCVPANLSQRGSVSQEDAGIPNSPSQ